MNKMFSSTLLQFTIVCISYLDDQKVPTKTNLQWRHHRPLRAEGCWDTSVPCPCQGSD